MHKLEIWALVVLVRWPLMVLVCVPAMVGTLLFYGGWSVWRWLDVLLPRLDDIRNPVGPYCDGTKVSDSVGRRCLSCTEALK